MQITRIDHINMSVKNLKDSLEWYEKLFSFKKVEEGFYEGEPWAITKSSDSLLCLYEDAKLSFSGHEAISHFGFNIGSREEWEDVLKKHNIKVMYGGAIRYPHSTSWYVVDPSGHEIEVSYWDNGNKITF